MVTIYVKGAPEEVIDMCNEMQMHDDGDVKAEYQEEAKAEVNELAKQGFRVICFGFCEISMDTF